MVVRPLVITALLSVLGAIGCGGVTDPSKNTVDPVSDVLNPGDYKGFPITVNKGGEYSVKITALSPTPTAVLGLVWGQGARCEFAINATYAQLNQQALSGPIFQKGAYTLCVYDPGTLTVAQTFTITVSHP